jgi:hypothetical protein
VKKPLLSVLIAGIPGPGRNGEELAAKIRKQAAGCDVEVLLQIDDQLSGPTRNDLTAASSGKYIAFVDDDDDVSADYVNAMLLGCRSNVDVVTMRLRFTSNRRCHESWQFALVDRNLRPHGVMMVNHLCAWRRSLATLVAWCPDLGNCDDHLWFEPLYHAKVVRTQYHIDKELYFYDYEAGVSENQKAHAIVQRRRYMGRGLRCWRDETLGILIEVPGGRTRDRHNQLHPLPNCRPFHTVKF